MIKSISISLSDINEMKNGILLRTDREFMMAAIKGGEVRRTIVITYECNYTI